MSLSQSSSLDRFALKYEMRAERHNQGLHRFLCRSAENNSIAFYVDPLRIIPRHAYWLKSKTVQYGFPVRSQYVCKFWV